MSSHQEFDKQIGVDSDPITTMEHEDIGHCIDEIFATTGTGTTEHNDSIAVAATPMTESLLNSTLPIMGESPPMNDENDNVEEDQKLPPARDTSCLEEISPNDDGMESHDQNTQPEESVHDNTTTGEIHNNQSTTTNVDSKNISGNPENDPSIMDVDTTNPLSESVETERKDAETVEEEQQQEHPAPLQLHHRLFAKKRKIDSIPKQKSPPRSQGSTTAATLITTKKEANGDSKRPPPIKIMATNESESSHHSKTDEEKIVRGSIMYKVLGKLNRLDPELVQDDDQAQNESTNMDSTAEDSSKPMEVGLSTTDGSNSVNQTMPLPEKDQLKRPPSQRIAFRSTVMPQRSKQIPKENHRIIITHGVNKGKTGFVIAEHDGRWSVVEVDGDSSRQVSVKNSYVVTLSAYLARNGTKTENGKNGTTTVDSVFTECLAAQLGRRSNT